MKRGLVLLVIFALMLPMAMAGQVSDFFKYFTNDAFSLITGAIVNNNPGSFMPSNIRSGQPPVTGTTTKPSGATCKVHSDCSSKVCTRLGAKSVCGKKPAALCKTDSECYSTKCLSTNGIKRCSTSPNGKPCLNNAECARGLTCISNRCASAPQRPGSNVGRQVAQGETTTQNEEQTTQSTTTNVETSTVHDEEQTTQGTTTTTQTETGIRTKIQDLSSRVDRLLSNHNVAQGQQTQNTPVTESSIIRRMGLSFGITGRFLLQLPFNIQNVRITNSAPIVVAKKINGQSCRTGTNCISGVCSKKPANAANGICGKGARVTCRLHSECFSTKCNNVCDQSNLNGICLQNTDCSTRNCNINTHKCAAAQVIANVGIVSQIIQTNQANGQPCTVGNNCRSNLCINHVCSTPVAAPLTQQIIQNNEQSAPETSTEEVSFVQNTAPVEEQSVAETSSPQNNEQSVQQEQFNSESAQARLLELDNLINSLKARVCREASNHNGINYGSIVCPGVSQ